MLLVEPFFKGFTKKEIPDTEKYAQAIVCLSAESREAVDKLVRLALEAGGTAPNEVQDQGFMYGHGFQDLDGHLWEVMLDGSCYGSGLRQKIIYIRVSKYLLITLTK